LRETLEDIDTKTAYKDDDYWHFFEAVEAFLYGERQEDNKGIYWGFSSFYDIWEDMCQTYVLNTPEYKERAIFADRGGYLEQFPNEYPINPFVRYLRPDVVLKKKEDGRDDLYKVSSIGLKQGKPAFVVKVNFGNLRKNYPAISSKFLTKYKDLSEPSDKTSGSSEDRYMFEEELNDFKKFVDQICNFLSPDVKIIDYKYMRISDYESYLPDKNGENKVKDDIQKQLVYEWTVQQNWNAKTESEFWIPYFSNNPLEVEKINPVKNIYFNKSQIKLVTINFKTLQDFYIKQGLL